MKRLLPLLHLVLPLWWWSEAGDRAIGRRTGDLVSHIWAIWNGTLGDPTRSALIGWPFGVDLLPIYGGWGHTFIGVALARAFELSPMVAYSGALTLYFVLAGLGGNALARALGASAGGGLVAGLLLQLDGTVLYNGTDGRPEHAGVGVAAMALALAIDCWRKAGWWRAAACGICGAAVLVVSWEQGLWLALAMMVLAPFLWWSGRTEGALQRWGLAAGSALLVATPWVGSFLSRALAVRHAGEGKDTLSWAVDQSTPLLGLITVGWPHPALPAMACMLLLPLTVPRPDRRLWLGLVLGLLASLLLATGPSPGLRLNGDLDPAHSMWGPFTWLQSLPVLGWFHSPARFNMGWGFAAAVAGGLAVSALARRGPRWLAGLLGAALVIAAGVEVKQTGNWPKAAFAPRPYEAARTVGDMPGDGALIELPLHNGDVWSEEARVWQLIHHRPTPATGFMLHMAIDRSPEILKGAPLLRWIARDEPGDAPVMDGDEQAALRASGLRFVAVYLNRLSEARALQVTAALDASFGEPVARHGDRWACWEIGGEDRASP